MGCTSIHLQLQHMYMYICMYTMFLNGLWTASVSACRLSVEYSSINITHAGAERDRERGKTSNKCTYSLDWYSIGSQLHAAGYYVVYARVKGSCILTLLLLLTKAGQCEP
jgi:cytochrome b561